ncbi:MAG: pyruvate:ferredoxin (flavodoxin) oxidoreductase [Bacilli bacterium]|nr:pyruvate:ferredoxin (flavodoxin) oxidoreductase [Bacilli bacterium]
MKKIMTIDGNEACSNTAYLFTEVAGIYPITPSSTMAEHVDEISSKKLNLFGDNVKVVEMQSEAGAAGFVHGSLKAGCLTTTFTASQGLLLMIPNMYKIAGEMLPCVIHVAARALSTHALSIFGDHQDIYACRSTGFAMLASSSVQDASYLSGVAHLSTIKSSIPFIHFFDGFRTSHEIQKINVLEDEDYKDMIDYEALNKFRDRALNPHNPATHGTAQNEDIYFQATEARNIYYDNIPDIVNVYMQRVNEKAGTNYKPFNYYGNPNATRVIVAMGSVCETIKEVIDSRQDVGLIEVHLYRPFSTKYLLDVLPSTVESIAVLDRTKEAGSNGEPLYLDICAALRNSEINIVGGRYGLASKNTTPSDINAVYEMLVNPVNNFTIGIVDDVTNLSLKPVEIETKICNEWLFYGYGSDGMVSASKSIIKLIGDNTDNYVQGYFQYDSKKSGGVTCSHLRFSSDLIKSTYYIKKPSLVVITKDSYLEEYDLLEDIVSGANVIINTIHNEEEINNMMNSSIKKILLEKNAKVYIINAYELAEKVGLKGKISTIMESAIMYLSSIIPYDVALEKMKESIYKKFSKKGLEVVNKNYAAITLAKDNLKLITLNDYLKENNKELSFIEMIMKRKGETLKTSDFVNRADGMFEAGTSTIEKRCVSAVTPKWNGEYCTNCNQCSLFCPHGVIRPFLINEEEYKKLPENIKSRCKKAIGMNYYFIISASVADCTGCGLCTKVCNGMKGNVGLTMDTFDPNEQEIFDYLDKNISKKDVPNRFTPKNSQFNKPKFAFSGACAGCGETPYIKLLTQLFGEHMIISNATGCSSIYGGSAPSTPYTLPWASSLFEDNAEFGYGMLVANEMMKKKITNIMKNNMDNENALLFKKWLENYNSYEITKEVYDNLTDNIPAELKNLKQYITQRNIWCLGGDGWAYDIGFAGIDHVLASNDNIKILVLDSQVYSNTGGQSSKSSPKGAIASFASTGKKNNKKDLARIAMSYPDCYVAQISLGANPAQSIKAMKEANEYNGPAIIIAYTPCISHGIKGGMENSVEMEKLATQSGYFLTFRRHPETGFTLDSKNVDFNLYEDFLNRQTRYNMLKVINSERAQELLESNKKYSMLTYEYYCSLDK